MAFSLKILVIFAFVWFQSNSCEAKHFCTSFTDNNNEISFIFRAVKPFDYDSQSYVFIDDHYWYLDFDQSLMSLNLWKTESKRPHHWFGPEYSLAFCLWRPYNSYCAIGLINKAQTSIDFRRRILQGEKLKQYVKLSDKPIKFINEFRPTVAFVVNNGKYENLTLFIEQHRQSDGTFDLSTELYEFDSNLNSRLVNDSRLRNEVNPTAISLLEPELEVIGVYRQVLTTRVNRRQDSPQRIDEMEYYGIVLVFKVNKMIKYCWTPDKTLDDSCKRENLKTLIDCSAYTKSESITRVETPTKTSSESRTFFVSTFFLEYFGLTFFKIALIVAVMVLTIKIVGYRKESDKKQYKLNLIYGEDFDKKLIKV